MTIFVLKPMQTDKMYKITVVESYLQNAKKLKKGVLSSCCLFLDVFSSNPGVVE